MADRSVAEPTPGPHPAEPSGAGRDRAFVVDAGALGVSALLTAGVGLVGWLIAARTLPPAEVGHASAFVNAFMLVAALGELGLGPPVLRWLPRAGPGRAVLVRRVYGAATLASLVVGAGWLLVTGATGVSDATAPWGLASSSALFAVAGTSWALFHLQDEVLTGLGSARWVPLENLVFAALRIGLLLLLGPGLGALGVVLSWVLPTALAVVAVTAVLAVRARRPPGADGAEGGPASRGRTGHVDLPDRREVVRLVAPVYPSMIALALMYNVVPLLVVQRFGAEPGAVFFVVWMGLNALDLAGTGAGNALVVRLAEPGSAPLAVLRRAAVRVLPPLAPVLLVPFVVGGWLLGLFGDHYANSGTELLRWVVAGFWLRAVTLLVVAAHLGAGRGVRMALVQSANTVGLVVLAAVAPTGDLEVLGVGFFAVQLVMAPLAVADLARDGRRTAARARAAADEAAAPTHHSTD